MSKYLMASLAVLLFPVVLNGGAALMSKMSGRRPPEKPLNQRLCGYNVEDVKRNWTLIKGAGELKAEEKLLEYDRAFPIFYGPALAASLLIASSMLGWPTQRLLLLIPVVVGMVADCVENTQLLGQLRIFSAGKVEDLVPQSIKIASAATSIKLVALCAASVFLIGLIVALVARGGRGGP